MNVFYPPHSTLTPGTRVVAYLRDSGGTNQEESVGRQEDEVRRWCTQYDLLLTAIYTDEAQTARHSLHKRKDLLSMMAHFRDGGVEQGIIIWNYERFARNIKHGRQFIAEIESMDKIICSMTDHIPEGTERYFIQDLKLWSAEQTSVKISIDVTSGLRRMVKDYRGMPGRPPRGFMRGEPIIIGKHRNGDARVVHPWVPDPDLIATVRLAFEMRARGATFKQLMEVTKLYPAVNSWKTFFSNRLYMGILEFGDLIIEDYCTPIVSAELWNQVQAVGVSRARIGKDNSPRRYASTFLFSGLLFCQQCGAPLNGYVIGEEGKDRRDYYKCTRRKRRGDCTASVIPARLFEQHILARLEEIAMDIDQLLIFQTRVVDHYKKLGTQLDGERTRLRRELKRQSKKIDNLTDAIGERGHSISLLNALHKTELEEATLKLELDNLEHQTPPKTYSAIQLKDIAAEVKDALRSEDLNIKKHAIKMLTSRIIVSRGEKQINGVLYYIPTVCVGGSAPTENDAEHIQFEIQLPAKNQRVTR